jgi:plastocyanin
MDNKNQTWMGVVAIGLLVIGGIWYMSMNQKAITTTSPSTSPLATTTPTPVTAVPAGSPQSSTPAAPIDKNTISMTKNAFDPKTVTVKVGDTVTWINNDSWDHNVTSDDKLFVSHTLKAGAKYGYTFPKRVPTTTLAHYM